MQSVKKFWLLLLSLLLVGSAIFAWSIWGQRYQIVLSEEQLIAKLNEKFPFSKSFFFVVDLSFSNPNLALESGSDRITFGCDVETNVKLDSAADKIPRPLRGTMKLSGNVRYDSSEAAFFLENPIVETLDIAGIPEKWRSKVRDGATKAVAEFLGRAPIYRLRPTDIKKAAARLILRDVRVTEKKLILTMGVG